MTQEEYARWVVEQAVIIASGPQAASCSTTKPVTYYAEQVNEAYIQALTGTLGVL
jgi:hypothetical protein